MPTIKRALVVLTLLAGITGSSFADADAGSATQGAATVTALGSRSGFSPGSEILWRSQADTDRELSAMAATGATWLRLDMPWTSMEATEGQIEWGRWDRIVDQAHANGLRILAIVAYAPSWARAPGCAAFSCPPADPADYARFLSAVVERYAPRGVLDYEIWNEPNLSLFWSPQPDPEGYTQLLIQAYTAAKAADDRVTVVAGALSPALDTLDGSSLNPRTFLDRMYGAGAGGRFDALSVHPYSYPYAPSTVGWWNTFSAVTPDLHAMMAAQGDGEKQIWGTEIGFPTGTSGDSVTLDDQARFVDEALTMWSAWSYTGPLLWYTFRDDGTDRSDTVATMGFVYADLSPKPALATFTARMAPAPPSTTTTTARPATTTTTAPPATTTTTAPPATTTTTAPPATTTTTAPPATTTTTARRSTTTTTAPSTTS